LRRALAAVIGICLLALLAPNASAQVNPPVPAPSGPVNPALPPSTPPGALPTPGDQAAPSASPTPTATPTAPGPLESPPASAPASAPASPPAAAPGTGAPETPAPAGTLEISPGATPSPSPTPSPTPPPIFAVPPAASVEPGRNVLVRINGAAGTILAVSADEKIATVVADQNQRALYITGQAVGSTTITVTDARGVTRDVPVRVAYSAGTIADTTALRVTGDPASASFVRDAAVQAAINAATLRPGARIYVPPDAPVVRTDLATDNRTVVDVPVQILGSDYITANGTTRVAVENYAFPRLSPSQLLVSDYPERLTADGTLFSATIDRTKSQRFLYYHYNPATEPGRRILVKATNTAAVPAVVHVLSALAGPGPNEMEVGHNATKGFLIRARRNEGTVITIPPNGTVNIINHNLPPGAIVNGILQLREVTGDPLNIAVIAQKAEAPLDQTVDAALLSGGAAHARGVYPVPEFFSEYTFFTDAPPLEIPIGQLPLPNLREGEALAGDYGVMQSLRVVIVNTSRFGQAIALYASPRGGQATGTFIIDDTLVQAHRLSAYSKYKIWQETIAPGTYRTLRISTMPEGGSSYPLRLIFAQDDGSVAPGAPGSPIY
jgi:Pilus formation protein N terminal region